MNKQTNKTKTKHNMSETTIDPLAMPAGEMKEPEFPVLKEGLYPMEVRTFTEESSEKDGKTTKRLQIKLATTKLATSTDGNTVHPGFAFNATVFLTDETKTATQIAELAAMPVKAALGKNTKVQARECVINPALIVGKLVDVKVGVREGKGDYKGSFSNVVKAWIIPS